MSSYLRLKKPSFKDGHLKVRIEWKVSAKILIHQISYSDHYAFERKVGLNKWITVADVKYGKIKLKVTRKDVCAKWSVDLPDPFRDITLKDCKKF